jgi:hypothetical protein
VLLTHTKREKSPRYTQSHRILGMKTLLELNCSLKVCQKSMDKAFYHFKKIENISTRTKDTAL